MLLSNSRVFGQSTLATLIRELDWSSTPLGSIATWSDTLLNAVNIILAAPVPMQILWGPHLVCIYNDHLAPAYSDKHPASLGRPCRDVWGEVWDTVGPQLQHVLEHGESVRFDEVFLPLLREGILREQYWSYSYSPIFDPRGNILGVLNVSQDATGRILAERESNAMRRATEASERRLRLAQEAGKSSSWEWDLASGAFTWDGGLAWTYGRPASELQHVDQVWQYIHPDDRQRVMQDFKPAIEGTGSYQSQFRVFWPDESVQWLDAKGGTVFGPDGRPEKIVGLNINVTDRKKSDHALIQNEKLAAVGRLAASIAHEINNPLEAVTNLAYLARHSQDMEEVQSFLKIADEELKRVSAITNHTLRFHRQSTHPIESACHDLFATVLAIYASRLANAGIILEKRKRAGRPVLCYDGDVRQVLSNLIGNAVDAMQTTGGRLILRSREGHDWSTGRAGVVLTVADTGSGMSPQVASRIFEAFYTTKGIGGTGLGMWISREIMNRHQGRISLSTSQRPGHTGTVFTLFLPFDRTAASPTPMSAPFIP